MFIHSVTAKKTPSIDFPCSLWSRWTEVTQKSSLDYVQRGRDWDPLNGIEYATQVRRGAPHGSVLVKHLDPEFNPRSIFKKLGRVACTCNPSTSGITSR